MDELGFYHIPHGPIDTSKKGGLTAIVTVKGGHLKEDELVSHLRRLIPINFQWEVQVHAPDTWLVPFPSKAELRRTINFGAADLKDGRSLSFEMYEEEEYFGEELPSVWMRVVNLPRRLRTFEVLWAIGTLLGATQKVDMVTTRKNKFGRFQVVVLNRCIVPTQMDVVIGSRFFELQFVIEPFDSDNEQLVQERRNDGTGDDNANQRAHDGKDGTNKKHKGDQPPDANTSQFQREQNGKGNSQGEMKEALSSDDMEDDDLLDDEWVTNSIQHQGLGSTTMDGAAVVLAPGSQNVLDKAESSANMGVMPACVEDEREAAREDREIAAFEHTEQVGANDRVVGDLISPSLARGPFLEKDINGLKEVTSSRKKKAAEGWLVQDTSVSPAHSGGLLTPLRRSARQAGSVDEDSLGRASRLAAKRNLDATEGNFYENSFLNF